MASDLRFDGAKNVFTLEVGYRGEPTEGQKLGQAPEEFALEGFFLFQLGLCAFFLAALEDQFEYFLEHGCLLLHK